MKCMHVYACALMGASVHVKMCACCVCHVWVCDLVMCCFNKYLAQTFGVLICDHWCLISKDSTHVRVIFVVFKDMPDHRTRQLVFALAMNLSCVTRKLGGAFALANLPLLLLNRRVRRSLYATNCTCFFTKLGAYPLSYNLDFKRSTASRKSCSLELLMMYLIISPRIKPLNECLGWKLSYGT